jgi:hypothetical protein
MASPLIDHLKAGHSALVGSAMFKWTGARAMAEPLEIWDETMQGTHD